MSKFYHNPILAFNLLIESETLHPLFIETLS